MLFIASLAVVILAAVGLAVLIRAAFVAPYAMEDERGFHVVEGSNDPSAAPVPVNVVTTPDLAFFHR